MTAPILPLVALVLAAALAGALAGALAMRLGQARRARGAEAELLRDGLESLGHAFALFDAGGRLVVCNRRYRAAYPAIADKLVPGTATEDILAAAALRGPHLAPGEDLADWVRQRVDRPLADAEAAWHRLADGRWYRISEFRTRAGGVVKLLTDVTEERRRSEALAHAQKMEAVGRLASGLAHEFNNIMTAVSGFAELARRTSTEPAVQGHLDTVVDGAGRAAGLTRQLLDLGRTPDYRPQRVRVDAAVGEVEAMIRFLAGPAVAVEVDLPAGAAEVSVDPTALGHALVNLAVNARDAMPDGGRLVLTAQRQANVVPTAADPTAVDRDAVDRADGAAWIALSVADTGTGMSEAVRDRVLEPFFTTKPAGEGTGLGLALVDATVRQAGGRVEIDSAPGAGTRVTLLLPEATDRVEVPGDGEGEGRVQAEDEAEAEVLAPATDAPAPAAPAEPALPLLVVDDEAPVRDWVALALEARGHVVLRAGSAAEAEARAAGRRIGLVISDVMLPDTTGPDLAARLAADRPGLPVVFMSGVEPRRPAGRRLVAPGAPLLAKPFGEAALAAAVDRALGGGVAADDPAAMPDGSDPRPSGGPQGEPRRLLAATAG